ncbi:MAG: DUF5630 domain-containing protein [Proteobacteria bacterium]|nr:DUF5630 domain-containing protein [Pseudomonadota bacterium]
MKNLSLFRELKFTWVEQPGLNEKKISEGFLKFNEAIKERNDDKRLKLLKTAGEHSNSFHAASLYCTERLKSLEIKSENFSESFKEITEWYLYAAQIHGSPTFLHLAIIYLDFARRTGTHDFYKQAYIYAKLGIDLMEFCNTAMDNAYIGKGFSSSNPDFATPMLLEAACLKEIKKINTNFQEKQFEKIIEEGSASFLEVVRIYTKQNKLINCEL